MSITEHLGHAVSITPLSDNGVALWCADCDVAVLREYPLVEAPSTTPITLIYTSTDRKRTVDIDISSWMALRSDRELQAIRSRFKRYISDNKMTLLSWCAQTNPQAQAFLNTELDGSCAVRCEMNDLYAWVETNRAYLMATA